MKLVKEYINEKFVPISDPIHDMGIGIINKVTSKTLSAIWDLLYNNWTEEEIIDEYRDEKDPSLNPEFIFSCKELLKDKLKFGQFFDWKEKEELERYIARYSRGRYAYTFTPGYDGTGVVFSKIKLPSATLAQYA